MQKENVIEQKEKKGKKKIPCVRVDWCEHRRLESDKVNPSAHPREWFTNKTTITFNYYEIPFL